MLVPRRSSMSWSESTARPRSSAAAALAIVAYREVGHYRERVAAIDALIAEKRHEKEALEERLGGGSEAE